MEEAEVLQPKNKCTKINESVEYKITLQSYIYFDRQYG